MKSIILLGASGSIGTQTVDVIKNNSDKYKLIAISVGSNIDYANELIDYFKEIEYVCVKNKEDEKKIKNNTVQKISGNEGLLKLSELKKGDILINALVGFVGMMPTINAIKNKKDIGLANKETLVTAGHIIMPLIKENHVKLLPIDSEHSAIFQVSQGIEKTSEINKLYITASGGSFRNKSREELKKVTISDALNHPNWSMGSKITIDSATMFNKGLEIIEAHYLFNVDYDKIIPIIHPESIIHSMIELNDGSIFAQMGNPDMRQPINFALSYPNHIPLKNEFSFDKFNSLNFKKVDYDRFPAIKITIDAAKIGGSMNTCLNAANEIAVDLFLHKKIKFNQIEEIVKKELECHELIKNPTIEEILLVDKIVREKMIKEYNG